MKKYELNILANTFGKEYRTKIKAFKELSKERYFIDGGFISNGMWMIPEAFEPTNFQGMRMSEFKGSIKPKDLFQEIVSAKKEEMKFDGLFVKSGQLVARLKSEKFNSYVSPEYLGIIPELEMAFDSVVFWQEAPLKPLLVDTDKNISIMVIMPIRVSED